ncbi:MAG: hypothetical protein A2X18_01685 [Bacteroidetes bacterium GWF2_40_14]|nr:MAG: hypothetical protein A2X18_01685 [Bacteroidetes bacterium GWF2_40_14]
MIIAEFDVDANNNFKQEITVDEPGLYYIDCKKWESIGFWAEDENVEVNFRGQDTAKMKIKNPPFHIIKGGPKNEVINHLNFINFRNYQSMIATSQIAYRASFTSDAEKQKATSSLYDASYEDQNARIKFLAELYADRTSVVALLKHLNYEKDRELIKKISDKINSIHPNYAPLAKFVREKEDAMEKAKKMADGSPAPFFEYPTPNGKMVGPKNYKGKVLLIDFWASWCGPCIAEIPNVKKVYEQYKDKGLEVLSVSIDKGSAEWLLALEKINMPWKQVLATNAGKEITSLYQFSGIPFIVLIDKEGKIVKKNLRGAAMEAAIKELLEK